MNTTVTPATSRPAGDDPAVQTPRVPETSAAPDDAACGPGDPLRDGLERLFRQYPAAPTGQLLRNAVSTYRRRQPP